VLLGLLQPQRWLQQQLQQPLDTSQHTAAIIIPVSGMTQFLSFQY
jgi:hypothetical protein